MKLPTRTIRMRRDYKSQAREALKEDRRRLRRMLTFDEWTCRAIAEEVGTTHGTIWRFKAGKAIEVETYLALVLWLDAKADCEAA